MPFNVCAEKCDECLFSAERIVSGRRMTEVLRTCKRDDRHFICHKHTQRGADVCCRGFYDRNPMASNLMRAAHRLGAVRFVDLEGVEK